jgi:hypothetical protein
MNSSSEDIKDMLEADSSLGLIYVDNLFIGREPAKPYNSVTIFDTPGFPPDMTLDKNSLGYERPAIQIRVRNIDYMTGWSLIESIKESLHGRAQESWNGTLYSVIACSSGPAMLDWDDNGNVRFIINFNLQRRSL